MLTAHPLRRVARQRWILAIAVLLASGAAAMQPPAAAQAAGSRYVSTSGNDASDGSSSRPWRTIQKAADVAPAGSTVYIRSGTYTGFVVRRSGLAGTPTKYTAYPGDAPVISGGAEGIAVYIHYWNGAVHDVTVSRLVIQNAAGGHGSGGGIVVQNANHVSLTHNTIRNNRSYGIYLVDASAVKISKNDISKNEVGIYLTRQGAGDSITSNLIHQNDRMVINTPSPTYDDYGATGIAFNQTIGHINVSGNRIWGHRATSYDYDWDGSGIEIWMASNIDIHGNTLFDNENVMETGSDKSMGCNNNRFTRNDAFAATTAGRSYGVFLRCAGHMLVANNTLYGFTTFAFQISHLFGVHGGWIDGLRVENNIIIATNGASEAYWIRSALPSSVVIDRNLLHNNAGGRIAYVDGRGATTSIGTFRSWTGRELSGMQVGPKFVNAAAHDFRLKAGSPAIDKGVLISGVTDGFVAAGPDLGRYERP